jgi:hypothetical protein
LTGIATSTASAAGAIKALVIAFDGLTQTG